MWSCLAYTSIMVRDHYSTITILPNPLISYCTLPLKGRLSINFTVKKVWHFPVHRERILSQWTIPLICTVCEGFRLRTAYRNNFFFTLYTSSLSFTPWVWSWERIFIFCSNLGLFMSKLQSSRSHSPPPSYTLLHLTRKMGLAHSYLCDISLYSTFEKWQTFPDGKLC